MLWICNPVLDFFLLVLRVSLLSYSDISNKRIRLSKAFSQKCLKLFSRSRVSLGALGLGLMLLPAIVNAILQKGHCKRYAFVALYLIGLEIVFALLTEIITFHVQIPIIEILVSWLERPIQNILSRFYWSCSRSRLTTVLHVSLHNYLKKSPVGAGARTGEKPCAEMALELASRGAGVLKSVSKELELLERVDHLKSSLVRLWVTLWAEAPRGGL